MNAFYQSFGLYNMRRVGGGTEGGEQGKPLILRSTDLHTLNDEGRIYFASLGLRTVIDLRDRAEREARPNALDGVGADVMTVPLFDILRDAGHGSELAQISEQRNTALMYAYMVRHCGPQIGAIAMRLAAPDALSAVIHCVGGKDRTAVVVATILSATGVSEDEIVDDYLLSAELEHSDWLKNFDFSSVYGAVTPGPFLERGWIQAALAEIRDGYGDAETYLLQHGVTPPAISSLRDAILGS